MLSVTQQQSGLYVTERGKRDREEEILKGGEEGEKER